jgi:ankyrin repeat protein
MKKTILLLFSAFTISMGTYAQDVQQALIEAVQAKNLDAVKKVVEELKADVNKPWDNKAVGKPYAIHMACKTIPASLDIVNYLLEKGAKLDVEDKFGVTPLISLFQTADTTNRLAICKLFIEKGADINAQSSGGGSVLGYACERGQVECVKLLVAKRSRP